MTRDPLAPLAARLRMAPGALYTVIVGLMFSLTLTLTGPPAAFSERRIVPSSGGLGPLASPPAESTTPSTTQPVVVEPDPPSPTPIDRAASPVVTRPPVIAPRAPEAENSQVDFGDVLTRADVPGRITGMASIVGGVVVAVDRDDVDPRIVRIDDSGEIVGSIVLTERDLSGDVDIAGVSAGVDGSLLALVNGPYEVVRVLPDGGTVERVAVIPDVPPCAVPLPVPVPCEPGLDDHEAEPVDVAQVGEQIVVSDAGQGILWAIDADGGVDIASSAPEFASTDETLGLRGLGARPGGNALVATVDDRLIEFILTRDGVTYDLVADLDEPGTALATDRAGDVAVLLAGGGVARYDATDAPLAPLSSLGRDTTAVALAADELWLARRSDGSASSLLVRLALSRRSS